METLISVKIHFDYCGKLTDSTPIRRQTLFKSLFDQSPERTLARISTTLTGCPDGLQIAPRTSEDCNRSVGAPHNTESVFALESLVVRTQEYSLPMFCHSEPDTPTKQIRVDDIEPEAHRILHERRHRVEYVLHAQVKCDT